MPKKSDERKREINIERGRDARARRYNRNQVDTGSKKRTQRPVRVDKTPRHDSSDDFSGRKSSVISQLSSLSHRTQNIVEPINQLDNNIKLMSQRIQNIKGNNYRFLNDLDQVSKSLEEKWIQNSANILNYSLGQRNNLLANQTQLERLINNANSIEQLNRLVSDINNRNRNLLSVESLVRGQIDDFENEYRTIDNKLGTIERTLANLEGSDIPWKKNESPVLAVRVHDLSNDKQGILTLTNYRILFEEIREEVIKKTLFFATEKRTVRDVIIDQPIGSIKEIEKGRVGFFKGAGLYIKFKPQTGLDEIKLDTSGNEDDEIIHYYKYIISGDAEQEVGESEEVVEDNAPVKCPNCSAPYINEILKGQTSVKCIYCGTVIKV